MFKTANFEIFTDLLLSSPLFWDVTVSLGIQLTHRTKKGNAFIFEAVKVWKDLHTVSSPRRMESFQVANTSPNDMWGIWRVLLQCVLQGLI